MVNTLYCVAPHLRDFLEDIECIRFEIYTENSSLYICVYVIKMYSNVIPICVRQVITHPAIEWIGRLDQGPAYRFTQNMDK